MLLSTAAVLQFGTGTLEIASSGPTATQIPVSAATPTADPEPGTVVRQTPADTRVAVPRVVGKPLDRAFEEIRKAGLAIGLQQAKSKRGAARFEVLSQTPSGGTRAARGTRIDVVYARPAAKGFARWFGRLGG